MRRHPFRHFQYPTVPLSVLPDVAHPNAQATAKMVLQAARTRPDPGSSQA
jgi:hypothetical protein